MNNVRQYQFIPFICSLALVGVSAQVQAEDYWIGSKEEYSKLYKQLEAGDTVILKNGEYPDFEIQLLGEGTEDAPITLRAETSGEVILTGQSNLRLGGEYLVAQGLVFTNGHTPTNEVIAFKKDSKMLAYHSRVTDTVIHEFSNPDKRESDYWVGIYGKNNRFDHNYLAGKRNRGVTLAVRLNSDESIENHHKIDHNYFGQRPVFGSNGGETIRVGTSHYSLNDSFTVIENNYFDKCDGEVEIISIKSGKNEIRNNTFFESRGTLTLRHGNGNIVEDNVFFGNGVDHTGGIRVINADQTVRNNYLEGLTGYRFGSGLTVMNGVPNSPQNRYHTVKNANISNNSLYNVDHIQLAAGADEERSDPPQDSVVKNNLLYADKGKTSTITKFDDISKVDFSDNVAYRVDTAAVESGIDSKRFKVKRAKNGLLYPTSKKLASLGVSRDLQPTTKADVGPSYFEKAPLMAAFGSGETIQVSPSENAIFDAVRAANDGDTLVLAAGEYSEQKTVPITKVLTIKGAKGAKPTVYFSRSNLFEIRNGGSLSLDGLVMDGKDAPDSDGNTLIRTSKWGMYVNFELNITNSVIQDLDINNLFSVFDAGVNSMANSITVDNVHFKDISGDAFRLHKEAEYKGAYNAEYLTITNSTFENVGGQIARVLRPGKDESTFGPHVFIEGNSFDNIGFKNTRLTPYAMWLHGVQVSRVNNNTFKNSLPIVIEHTVGEPVTEVTGNTFDKAELLSIKEMYFTDKPTGAVVDNTVSAE